MSERLLGPDLNSRLAYLPSGGALLSAVGLPVVIYANPSGNTLADILTYNGTPTPGAPIINSTLTVDSDSLIPQFWFPENTDTVYIEVNGGTRTPANADYDFRVDNVSGYVNAPLVSTGLLAGGNLSPNPSNPRAVDIAPYVAYIVDYSTNSFSPTVTRLSSTTTQTVVLDAAAQTRVVTWWSINANGTFHQSADRPSDTDRRQRVQLGPTLFDPIVGNVFLTKTVPIRLFQVVNQLYDLMYALGGFSVSGNVIGTNGATLSISKTVGTAFSPSASHESNSTDPHIIALPHVAPLTFRHATRVPDSYTTVRTTIDVANYDLNGVVTPIGGGVNTSSLFRVWYVPLVDPSFQYIIQYGQTTYSSLSAAVAAIGHTTFAPNSQLIGTAVLLGHIAAIRTATNLTDPTQASIIPASSKFQRP